MLTATKSGQPSESKSQSHDSISRSGHKASEAATAFGQGAESVAEAVANTADDAAAATGRGLESVAEGIRKGTPRRGFVGAASNKVADSLEYGGKYLEGQGVTGMIDDLTKLIRNNPVSCMVVGVGLGFMLARITSTKNA